MGIHGIRRRACREGPRESEGKNIITLAGPCSARWGLGVTQERERGWEKKREIIMFVLCCRRGRGKGFEGDGKGV